MSRPTVSDAVVNGGCFRAIWVRSLVSGAQPDGMYVGDDGSRQALRGQSFRRQGRSVDDRFFRELPVRRLQRRCANHNLTVLCHRSRRQLCLWFVELSSIGVSSRVSGQFTSDETVTGNVDLAARVGGGCCNLNTTFNASLEGGGGGGGSRAFDYFVAAIAHTPGVGDSLWRRSSVC